MSASSTTSSLPLDSESGTVTPRRSPRVMHQSLPGVIQDPSPEDFKLVSAASYRNALLEAFERLQFPTFEPPPPEHLRKEFARALTMKNSFLVGLAEAELRCQTSEDDLRQILGEAEVQRISQAQVIVDADEADTMKGQYITAVSRIRIGDYCLSRRLQ